MLAKCVEEEMRLDLGLQRLQARFQHGALELFGFGPRLVASLAVSYHWRSLPLSAATPRWQIFRPAPSRFCSAISRAARGSGKRTLRRCVPRWRATMRCCATASTITTGTYSRRAATPSARSEEHTSELQSPG